MAIKDKKSKQKRDEFDFDDDMDFGDFDFNEVDSKANPDIKDSNSRNPVSSVFKGVVGGAATKFTDPRFLSRSAQSALPDEFSVVSSTIDKAAGSFKSMYDESVREIKPQVAQLTRRIDKLIPENRRTLKKISSKFAGMFNEDSGYNPTSPEEQQNQAIAASLGSIFQVQNEKDMEMEARNQAKENIKDNIDKKRFDANLQVMTAMGNNIAFMASYTKTINQSYQKKSLELQYRSYFAQAELLKTSQKYFEIFKVQNEAISKNTALPEFVKLKESERFKELTRNKFYDSMRDKLFGGAQEALNNALKRIGEKVREKVRNTKDAFQEGLGALDMVEMMVEQNKMMEEAGMGKTSMTETIGNVASGSYIEKIAEKAGVKAKKLLSENKEAYEKVFKIINYFQDIEGSARKLKNSEKIKGMRGEGGLSERIGEALFQFLDLVKPPAPDTALGKSTHSLKDLNEPGFYSKRTERTINEIIPGYLALQLAELSQIRKKKTENPDSKAVQVFDMKTSKFISKDSKSKAAKETFDRSVKQNSNRAALERTLKALAGDETFNESDTRDLLKLINAAALGHKSANLEELSSTSRWKDLDSRNSASFKRFKKAATNNLSSEVSRNAIIRGLDDSRRSFADMRGEMADIIGAGDVEAISELMGPQDKDGNYVLDTAKYMAYVEDMTLNMSDEEIKEHNDATEKKIKELQDSLRKAPTPQKAAIKKNIETLTAGKILTSDVNVKTAFSKMNPRKALSAVKNTIVSKWKYRSSQNKGDGTRIGPMAQDVKKNMGERAAPGGKMLNMIDLNGINMSAIQQLNKQFEQSLKADNSAKYLKSIDTKMSHSLKLLSSINKTGAISASVGVSGQMAEGGSQEVNRGKRILKDIGSLTVDAGAATIEKTTDVAKGVYQHVVKPVSEYTWRTLKALRDPATDLAKKGFGLAKGLAEKSFGVGKDLVTDKIPKAVDMAMNLGGKVKGFFSNKFKDLYIPGMPDMPALKAQLLKLGYYIDKESGKVIETLDDIKGDVVDRAGNLILSVQEMKNGFVDKNGKEIKGFAVKVFDKAKAGAEYLYEKGKDVLKTTFDLIRGKFDPGSMLGKLVGGVGSLIQSFTGLGGGNKTYRVLLDIRDLLRKGKKVKLRSDDDENNDKDLKKKLTDVKDKVGKFFNKEEMKEKIEKIKNSVNSTASFILGPEKAKELRNRWTAMSTGANFEAHKEKFYSTVDSAVKSVKENGLVKSISNKVKAAKNKLKGLSEDQQMDMFGGGGTINNEPGLWRSIVDKYSRKKGKTVQDEKGDSGQQMGFDFDGPPTQVEKKRGLFSRMFGRGVDVADSAFGYGKRKSTSAYEYTKGKAQGVGSKVSGYVNNKLDNSGRFQMAKGWFNKNKNKMTDAAGSFTKGIGGVMSSMGSGAGNGEQGTDPNVPGPKSSLFQKAWTIMSNNSLVNKFKKDELRQQAKDEEKQNELKALQEGGPSARYKAENVFDNFLNKAKGVWDIGKNIVTGAMSLFGMIKGAGLVKGLLGIGTVAAGTGVAAGTATAAAGTLAAGAAAGGAAATTATVAAATGLAATTTAAGTLAVGAGSALLAGLATGAAWLLSPAILPGAAILALAAGGMYLQNKIIKKQTDEVQRIRYAQYGFYGKEDEEHLPKLKELEAYLLDGSHVRYAGEKASLMNLDTEKILTIFDVPRRDQTRMNDFIRWFHLRFKPFFLGHVAILRTVNKNINLSEVITAQKQDQLAYLQKIQMDDGPYNVSYSPVGEKQFCKDNQSIVSTMREELVSKLKEEVKERGFLGFFDKNETNGVKTKSLSSNTEDKDKDVHAKSAAHFAKVNTNLVSSKDLVKDQQKFAQQRQKELQHLLSEGEDGQELDSVKETDAKNLKSMRLPKIADGELSDGKEGMKYIKFEKKSIDITGLNPALFKNLMMMAQEYGEATGKSILITSGYRTYAEQATFHKTKGGAKPGTSLHEFGLALDINSPDLAKLEEMGLMRKYGFTRPIGGEPWHTEAAGIQPVLAKVKKDPDLAAELIKNSIMRGGGGVGTMPDAPKNRRNIDVATALFKAGGDKVKDIKNAYEEISGETATSDKKDKGSSGTASTSEEAMSGYVSRGSFYSQNATAVSEEPPELSAYGLADDTKPDPDKGSSSGSSSNPYVSNNRSPFVRTNYAAPYQGNQNNQTYQGYQYPTQYQTQDNPYTSYSQSPSPASAYSFPSSSSSSGNRQQPQAYTPRQAGQGSYTFPSTSPTPAASVSAYPTSSLTMGMLFPTTASSSFSEGSGGGGGSDGGVEPPVTTSISAAKATAPVSTATTHTVESVLKSWGKDISTVDPLTKAQAVSEASQLNTQWGRAMSSLQGYGAGINPFTGKPIDPAVIKSTITDHMVMAMPNAPTGLASTSSVGSSSAVNTNRLTPNTVSSSFSEGSGGGGGSDGGVEPMLSPLSLGPTGQLSLGASTLPKMPGAPTSSISTPAKPALSSSGNASIVPQMNPYMAAMYSAQMGQGSQLNPYLGYAYPQQQLQSMYGAQSPYMQQYMYNNPLAQQAYGFRQNLQGYGNLAQNQFQGYGAMLQNQYRTGLNNFTGNLRNNFANSLIKDLDPNDPNSLNDPRYMAYMAMAHGADPRMMIGNMFARGMAGQGEVGQFGAGVWQAMTAGNMSFTDALKTQGTSLLMNKAGQMLGGSGSPFGSMGSDIMAMTSMGVPLKDAVKFQGTNFLMNKGIGFLDNLFGYKSKDQFGQVKGDAYLPGKLDPTSPNVSYSGLSDLFKQKGSSDELGDFINSMSGSGISGDGSVSYAQPELSMDDYAQMALSASDSYGSTQTSDLNQTSVSPALSAYRNNLNSGLYAGRSASPGIDADAALSRYSQMALSASDSYGTDAGTWQVPQASSISKSVSPSTQTSSYKANSKTATMDQIYDLALSTGRDPRDLLTKAASESGFAPNAKHSSVKVHGLFQIHENNWKGWKGSDGVVKGGWAKDKAFVQKLKGNGIDPDKIDFYDPLTNYLMAEKHHEDASGILKKTAGYDLPENGPMSYLFHVAGGGPNGINLAKALKSGDLDVPADQVLSKEVLTNNPFFYKNGKISSGTPTLRELVENTEKHYGNKTGEFKIDDYLATKKGTSVANKSKFDDGAGQFTSNKKVSYRPYDEEDEENQDPEYKGMNFNNEETELTLPEPYLQQNWNNILKANEDSYDDYDVNMDANELISDDKDPWSSIFSNNEEAMDDYSGSSDDSGSSIGDLFGSDSDSDSGGGFFGNLFGGIKDTVTSGFSSLFGSGDDSESSSDSGGGFFGDLFGGIKDTVSTGFKEVFGGSDMDSIGSSIFDGVKDVYAQTRNQMSGTGQGGSGQVNPFMQPGFGQQRPARGAPLTNSMGPAMRSMFGMPQAMQGPVQGDAFMPAMDPSAMSQANPYMGMNQFMMPGFGAMPANRAMFPPAPQMPFLNPNEQLMYPGQPMMNPSMGFQGIQNNPFSLVPPGAGMGYGQYSGQGQNDAVLQVKTGVDKTNTLLETNNQQNEKLLELLQSISEKAVGPDLIAQAVQAITSAISQASGKAVSVDMPSPTQSKSMPNIGVSMDRNIY